MLEDVGSAQESTEAAEASIIPKNILNIPAADEGLVLPSTHIEWWDEAFLPKDIREQRKKSKAALLIDNFDLLALVNNKTHRLLMCTSYH